MMEIRALRAKRNAKHRANPLPARKASAAWYARNKAAILVRKKRYYRVNADRIRAKQRARYYAKNHI